MRLAQWTSRRSKERGAALITVLVAMMIMSILLLEFQYNAMVERKLAYNELNQLQAYYLAKGGIRIGLLRVSVYGRALANPSLKQAFGGAIPQSLLDMIWSMPLPPFPPEKLTSTQASMAARSSVDKVLKQTMVKEGRSTHVIRSENAKINLNFLAEVPAQQLNQRIDLNCRNPDALYKHVACILTNLLDNFLKESEDPVQEYGNMRPEEVVFDIMDWVNPGENRFQGGSKDNYYQSLKPPLRAKRNRFYTLDELRLVKGIDEHLFNKLKPFVTVYSHDGKININSIGGPVYKALFPDFTEDDITKILEKRKELNGWPDEGTFVNYVSSTLGRSGFQTLYSDANSYPFTVASKSFVIESMGILQRSKSQIQKVIQVGVVLTRAKAAGGLLPNITSQQACDNNDPPNSVNWWDTRFGGQCRAKPTDTESCRDQGGVWFENKSDRMCRITNLPDIVLPKVSPGARGGTQTQAPPNAMKILYWSET